MVTVDAVSLKVSRASQRSPSVQARVGPLTDRKQTEI